MTGEQPKADDTRNEVDIRLGWFQAIVKSYRTVRTVCLTIVISLLLVLLILLCWPYMLLI